MGVETKVGSSSCKGSDREHGGSLHQLTWRSVAQISGILDINSKLRDAIIPPPRQRGVDGEEAPLGTSSWSWARLLGRVFALDMATCPLCRCGSLRIIAAITQESVITRILRHCKLASVPPPIAPARARQERFAFDEAHAA